MIINTNPSALNALGNLNKNEMKSASSLEKLSSGFRINRAADDGAGIAISEKMRGQIRGLSQAGRNIQDGVSLIQVTDSALGQITDNIQRMRELAVQSSNGTLNNEDRKMIQREFGQLIGSVGDIAKDTQFNTLQVLSPPEALTASGTTSITSSEVDIIFIIDTTGSMTSKIASIKSNIQSLADSLSSRGVDFRLGIVAYGDTTGGDPIVQFPLTNDVASFKGNIDAMSSTSGGDLPESGLEAIMDPTNGALTFPFRSSASKEFLVVTDADVHDDMDSSNPGVFNIDTVASTLKAAGIKTTVVGTIGGNPQMEWEKITTATGGSYLNINAPFSNLFSSYADEVAIDSGAKTEDTQNMPTLLLQVGANEDNAFKVELFDARPRTLGIDMLEVDPYAKAQVALNKLDDVIRIVSTQRGKFGAYQNALAHIASNVSNAEENLIAAESRIRDMDMAKETVQFRKTAIISQAAQAMLAQANQQTQGVLQLLE